MFFCILRKTKSVMDFYQILGVSPTANLTEIKVAYRRAARSVHPDIKTWYDRLPVRWGRRVSSETLQAPDIKDVNHAFEVLGDPLERDYYDSMGHAAYVEAERRGGVIEEEAEPATTARAQHTAPSEPPEKRTRATIGRPSLWSELWREGGILKQRVQDNFFPQGRVVRIMLKTTYALTAVAAVGAWVAMDWFFHLSPLEKIKFEDKYFPRKPALTAPAPAKQPAPVTVAAKKTFGLP